MNIYEILGLLFAHWVADFVCQTQKMSENKSRYWGDLLNHTSLYSVIMWGYILGITQFNIITSSVFFIVTFTCHTITDYFSSRRTRKLYEDDRIHDFFVVIGFDQWLHYVQLFITYWFLIK
jgi:hypothetical protein